MENVCSDAPTMEAEKRPVGFKNRMFYSINYLLNTICSLRSYFYFFSRNNVIKIHSMCFEVTYNFAHYSSLTLRQVMLMLLIQCNTYIF